jgi:hypothetical protein
MSTSFVEAFLKAGLVRVDETPIAVIKRRSQESAAEMRQRVVDAAESIRDRVNPEPEILAVRYKIERSNAEEFFGLTRRCSSCREIFTPRLHEFLCPECSLPETVERVRGEMVWLHKTAPVLEIRGRKPSLKPEDYAAGRRRS